MRSVVLLLGACLAGCFCNTPSGKESNAGSNPAAPASPAADSVAPARPAQGGVAQAPVQSAGEGKAASVKLINGTAVDAKLNITHGPLSALHVAGVDGALGPLLLDDPRMFCRCECRPGMRCPECEPPVDEFVDLAPGEAHTFEWNGKLGRFKKDGEFDYCMETFPAPAGKYIIKVCSEGMEGCAVEEIELPLSEPLELSLMGTRRAKMSCSNFFEDNLKRVVKMALVRMELHKKGPDVSACRLADASCVNTKDRDALAPRKGCRIAVIPTNASTEVMVITEEGAYSTFFDPDEGLCFEGEREPAGRTRDAVGSIVRRWASHPIFRLVTDFSLTEGDPFVTRLRER